MSVSLREQIAKLIDAGFDVGCDCNACKDMLGIADQILALIGKCRGRSADMDIHKIKVGDKIIYSNPNAGYDYDRDLAKKWLKLNEVYTIANIVVGDWRTDIYLEEKEGIKFNSVSFSTTPTFSGGEDIKPVIEKGKATVRKFHPTEQKECLHISNGEIENKCMECGKPIPAEKKGLTIEQKIMLARQNVNNLPKPKDRIEELPRIPLFNTFDCSSDAWKHINDLWKKQCEIIHHINKES